MSYGITSTSKSPSTQVNIRFGDFASFSQKLEKIAGEGLQSKARTVFSQVLGPGIFAGVASNFLGLAVAFAFLNNVNKNNVKAAGKLGSYFKDSDTFGAFDHFFSNIISGSFNNLIRKPFEDSGEIVGNSLVYISPPSLIALEDPAKSFLENLKLSSNGNFNRESLVNNISNFLRSDDFVDLLNRAEQNNLYSDLSNSSPLSPPDGRGASV